MSREHVFEADERSATQEIIGCLCAGARRDAIALATALIKRSSGYDTLRARDLLCEVLLFNGNARGYSAELSDYRHAEREYRRIAEETQRYTNGPYVLGCRALLNCGVLLHLLGRGEEGYEHLATIVDLLADVRKTHRRSIAIARFMDGDLGPAGSLADRLRYCGLKAAVNRKRTQGPDDMRAYWSAGFCDSLATVLTWPINE